MARKNVVSVRLSDRGYVAVEKIKVAADCTQGEAIRAMIAIGSAHDREVIKLINDIRGTM